MSKIGPCGCLISLDATNVEIKLFPYWVCNILWVIMEYIGSIRKEFTFHIYDIQNKRESTVNDVHKPESGYIEFEWMLQVTCVAT